jgi:hypothetical protein
MKFIHASSGMMFTETGDSLTVMIGAVMKDGE